MSPYLIQAGVFLTQVVFGLLILLFLIRFLLSTTAVSFHNPIARSIFKATNTLVSPIARWLPRGLRYDYPAVVIAWLFALLQVLIVVGLLGRGAGWFGYLVLAICVVADWLVLIVMFSIIVIVILSWVAPRSASPVVPVIHAFAAPVLRPLRGLLPPLGGFDLSPLVAIVLLQLTRMLLLNPIQDAAYSLL